MLSPRYLDGLSDEIAEIYSRLETDILQDMAHRLSRLGKVTDATKWQAQMLAEAGGLKKNIRRILAKYDKEIVRQIEQTFTDALEANARNDNRIFKAATGRTVSAPNAQAMLSTIQKCHSDLSRLTLTTAATTETQFVQQANRVYMQTQSGAFDYDTAMKSAADELSKRGITAVQYENGKPVTRTIESAVRMNILTSINQTAANQTLSNAEELGVEKFEVSAHIGARPEHEAWQGKIFTKKELYSVCGLGSVTGLCGINCRHSFYPYFEDTEEHYTQKDLDGMAEEKVRFNGKEMTRYESEQKLRQIERNIRQYKRKALTQEAAGVDNTGARRKLGEWQAKARDFTRQTGIARDRAREYVGTSGKQPAGLKLVESSIIAPKKDAPKVTQKETPITTDAQHLDKIKTYDFFTKDIKDNDKQDFVTNFAKVSEKSKSIIAKYGKHLRADLYTNTNGYYSPRDNKIHLDITKITAESTACGYSKNISTFLHEMGHQLDYNIKGNGVTVSSTMTDFRKKITEDALNYINKTLDDKNKIYNFARNTQKEKEAFRNIAREVWKFKDINSSVSDLLEAVSNGKIVDGYGHGRAYWKRPQALEKEAFAEMFEALATGKERKNVMEKYFPTAFKYFQERIEELLK